MNKRKKNKLRKKINYKNGITTNNITKNLNVYDNKTVFNQLLFKCQKVRLNIL